MKVILLKDTNNLGKANQVVEVKDGYAKNFLIKQKIAVPYTEQSQQILNQKLDVLKHEHDLKLKEANELKSKIEQITLVFTLKSNGENYFGSISIKTINDELKDKHNIVLNKFMFDNKKNEKNFGLGVHEITIKLFESVNATLRINVKGEK